jgi:hypothetical protein
MFFSKQEKTQPEENLTGAVQATDEGKVFESSDTETVHENPPVGAWEEGVSAIEKIDYPPLDANTAEPAVPVPNEVPAAKPAEKRKMPFFPKAAPAPARQYADAFGEHGTGVPEPGPDPRNKVLSVFAMLGFFVVMTIPFVNLLMAVRWTFGKKTNRNLRNLSITMLFFFAVVMGIYIYLMFVR